MSSKYTVTVVFRSGHAQKFQCDECRTNSVENTLTNLKITGGAVQGLYIRLDAIDLVTCEVNE